MPLVDICHKLRSIGGKGLAPQISSPSFKWYNYNDAQTSKNLAGFTEMILFPYAKDVDYDDGDLSFTLQFFNADSETQIAITMKADSSLREIMEKLLV